MKSQQNFQLKPKTKTNRPAIKFEENKKLSANYEEIITGIFHKKESRLNVNEPDTRLQKLKISFPAAGAKGIYKEKTSSVAGFGFSTGKDSEENKSKFQIQVNLKNNLISSDKPKNKYIKVKKFEDEIKENIDSSFLKRELLKSDKTIDLKVNLANPSLKSIDIDNLNLSIQKTNLNSTCINKLAKTPNSSARDGVKDKDLLKKIVHLKKENSDSKYSNNKSSKSTKALSIKTKFSSNGEKNSNIDKSDFISNSIYNSNGHYNSNKTLNLSRTNISSISLHSESKNLSKNNSQLVKSKNSEKSKELNSIYIKTANLSISQNINKNKLSESNNINSVNLLKKKEIKIEFEENQISQNNCKKTNSLGIDTSLSMSMSKISCSQMIKTPKIRNSFSKVFYATDRQKKNEHKVKISQSTLDGISNFSNSPVKRKDINLNMFRKAYKQGSVSASARKNSQSSLSSRNVSVNQSLSIIKSNDGLGIKNDSKIEVKKFTSDKSNSNLKVINLNEQRKNKKIQNLLSSESVSVKSIDLSIDRSHSLKHIHEKFNSSKNKLKHMNVPVVKTKLYDEVEIIDNIKLSKNKILDHRESSAKLIDSLYEYEGRSNSVFTSNNFLTNVSMNFNTFTNRSSLKSEKSKSKSKRLSEARDEKISRRESSNDNSKSTPQLDKLSEKLNEACESFSLKSPPDKNISITSKEGKEVINLNLISCSGISTKKMIKDLSTIDKDSSLSPTPGNRGEKLLNKIRSRVKLEKKESLK